MSKKKLLNKFLELDATSLSDFQSEEDFQDWASKVDPLIRHVNFYYSICFSAARGRSDKETMLREFQNAKNKLKTDIDLSGENSVQEYYPPQQSILNTE